MNERRKPTVHERWAHLRFSIVGPLLAAPPPRGELRAALDALATKQWLHPVTGERVRFGVSTIERWLYQARRARADPVGALRRKIRKDAGSRAVDEWLKQAITEQYAAHRAWSYQLHFDNLVVVAGERSAAVPSYTTIRRYMKSIGLVKRRRLSSKATPGAERAEARLDEREVRSFENPNVNGLWHLDFHHGSRKVLTPAGTWATPILLGILDDHSRLVCHLQWYLAETAENLVHGLSQAFQKRGLPRSLLTDNGSAMVSAEVEQGLLRLSVTHDTTLPHSPYQNAKMEVFWGQVEGRLLAMLEGCAEVTLALLNEATQAWCELDYNRDHHAEIGAAPLRRFLDGNNVGRPSPASAALRLAFGAEERRTQRRSDGTVSIEGRRFEIPSRYRHLEQVVVRFAAWDLAHVHLVDDRTSQVLCRLLPLDKERNADGLRRALDRGPATEPPPTREPGIAPLLAKLMRDYAATGLPPAYLPKNESETT